MSESDKKSQENLDEALIDILKNIQSKLLHKEVSHFNDFIGEMNQKVENIENIVNIENIENNNTFCPPILLANQPLGI